jgi:hypothetical protein
MERVDTRVSQVIYRFKDPGVPFRVGRQTDVFIYIGGEETAAPGTETGAFAGMVIGYWEQACALLNYGLLHEELFFETSGEFFGVWELLKPVVPQFRERFSDKNLLANLEQAARRFEAWSERRSPGRVAAMREFMQRQRAKIKAASSD